MDNIRADFEKWYANSRPAAWKPFVRVSTDERYESMETEWAYRGYKAATEAARGGEAVFEVRLGAYDTDGTRPATVASLTEADLENLPHGTKLHTHPPAPVVPEGWHPMETAPRAGRELILLLTPSGWPQVAYSNTWWIAGFSAENKPKAWLPIPAAPESDQ